MARWRHDQHRCWSRPETVTVTNFYIGRLLKCHSKVLWCSVVEAQSTQVKQNSHRTCNQCSWWRSGWVVQCALISSLRTSVEQQRSWLTAAFAAVWLEDQPALSCSSPPYWKLVPVSMSARHGVTRNVACSVSPGVSQNSLWQWQSIIWAFIVT